jgi:hypothetical protein
MLQMRLKRSGKKNDGKNPLKKSTERRLRPKSSPQNSNQHPPPLEAKTKDDK